MIPGTPLTGTRHVFALRELQRVIAVTDATPRTSAELAKLCGLTPAKVQQAIQRNENRFERISIQPNAKRMPVFAYRIKI